MVELQWWEAALLALIPVMISGIVGITTAVLTHWLTTSATRRGEEQTERRRIAEEERAAIRARRAHRAKPIEEFLELARELSAAESTVRAIADGLGESDEKIRDSMPPGPNQVEFARAFATAGAGVNGEAAGQRGTAAANPATAGQNQGSHHTPQRRTPGGLLHRKRDGRRAAAHLSPLGGRADGRRRPGGAIVRLG